MHRELFGNRRDGAFVDIGAHNGVTFSNTLFFERELNWRGLCVEPIPEVFSQLVSNRQCTCVHACVAEEAGTKEFVRVHGYAEMLSGIAGLHDPRHVERIHREVRDQGGALEVIRVQSVRLDALLAQHGITSIDLLCIDVEGAELDVLGSFDLRRARPAVVCIENNYRDARIWRVMRRGGYLPFARIEQDEIYVAPHKAKD